jgi:hypothetical protein
MSDELLHATGVDLDFADCSLPSHHRVDAAVNMPAIHREVSERILSEQPDAPPELVRHEYHHGEDPVSSTR